MTLSDQDHDDIDVYLTVLLAGVQDGRISDNNARVDLAHVIAGCAADNHAILSHVRAMTEKMSDG